MNKAIVSGASGFIGRWLVRELIDNGIEVFALVRNFINDESDEVFSNSSVHQLLIDDIMGEKNASALDAMQGATAFFHLAWGGVSSELKNDWDIQLKNIDFSVKMLDLAKKLNVQKFVATGTVAEYSFCENVMDVYAKQTPNDMYGASKTATHYLLEVRARLIDMPFIWAVIPSTYGEGRRDKNILTYTINTLLAGGKPQFGYLTQMWDFLYVSEVVRALRLIGEKGKAGKIYGIGSGIYRPLREYIEIIRDEIDPTLSLGIGEVPSYSAKVFSSCVNIDELKKDTGFVPQVSFEEGIKKTIDYYRSQM